MCATSENISSRAAVSSDKDMKDNTLVSDFRASTRLVATLRSVVHSLILKRVSADVAVSGDAMMRSNKSAMLLTRFASIGTNWVIKEEQYYVY